MLAAQDFTVSGGLWFLVPILAIGFYGLARKVFGRLLDELDPAAAAGMSGLLGLGVAGWITLPIGLLPNGLVWGQAALAALALVGLVFVRQAVGRDEWVLKFPSGWRLAMLAAVGLAFLLGLIGVLGPVDGFEWDSLAYHLAVPKLWLETGQITHISTIHHSNFPIIIDNLYVWGLSWGGAAGAKSFSLMYAAFGALAIFGLTRRKYGETAAWWATLALLAIPVAMWEIGTAYIDLSHGLWAGLSILFAAETLADPSRRHRLWLTVICVGFAAASKYTGLQIAISVAMVLFVGQVVAKRAADGFRSAAAVGLGALAICSPWLIKNAVWNGNPVYPFFYEVFHGKNWSPFNAEIYKNEQQTFGVGRSETGRDWSQFPHAVFGLAYQPGRYTNPFQTEGRGFPTGAIGVVSIASALCWMISGLARRWEWAILSSVAICFVMWFALSQQSRYAMNMAIPLCVLAGGYVVRSRAGPILAALIAAQFAYSIWLIKTISVDLKLPVLLGKTSAEDYLRETVSFYENAKAINADPSLKKVALFEEVFGFYLDKPYIWANPGHSTIIPYDELKNGDDFVVALQKVQVTHVYVSFAQEPFGLLGRVFRPKREGAEPPPSPTGEERNAAFSDPQQKWKVLILWASESGRLKTVWANASGALFEITER